MSGIKYGTDHTGKRHAEASCEACGARELYPDAIAINDYMDACEAFAKTHRCPPELIKVHVKTDATGAAETVILEGRVIPNALVDVDLHLGRVTLTFPAKVVVF